MISNLAATLLAAAFQALPVPDTVLRPPGEPPVALVHSAGPGVAVVHAEIVVPAGARASTPDLEVLRTLALERMHGVARRVGARVDARLRPWGLAYTVSGPEEQFEYLAAALRAGLAAPDAPAARLEALRREATPPAPPPREALLARLVSAAGAESAEGGPRAATPAAGGADARPSPTGAPGPSISPNIDTDTHFARLWAHTHTAAAVRFVVVSEQLEPAVVRAALAGALADADRARATSAETPPNPDRREPSAAPADPPHDGVVRTWWGLAYRGGPADPALALAARLAADLLPAPGDALTEFETRTVTLAEGDLFVLLGAAPPTDRAGLRTALEGTVARILAAPDDALRAAAAAESFVRRAAARSPWGAAAAVGEAWVRLGDPRAHARALESLERLDHAGLRRLLRARLAGPPLATAEVVP